MRMSNLFFQTLREAPAEAEIISHQLMVRSSMIQPIAAGIFDILPLAQRVKHKIENIMREEMDGIGGQEVSLPVCILPRCGSAVVAGIKSAMTWRASRIATIAITA